MAIKKWPPDDGTVNFDELVKPVVKAIRFAYSCRRKNEKKDIPYDGYDRPSLLACCLTVESTLAAANLDYDKTVQGRSALDILVGLAVQLGYEQGYRKAQEEVKLLQLVIGIKGDSK